MLLKLAHVDPRRFRACALGIALGAREVGVAVVTGERLLTASVLNVRKIRSPDMRQRRFEQAVSLLLDAYAVTRLAFVADQEGGADQAAWLEREARRREVPATRLLPARVRAALCGPGARPSNGALARQIVGRFPLLWNRSPDSEAVPGASLAEGLRRRTRSHRARYHARMFLAAGAAMLDLDEFARSRSGV